MKQPIKFIIVIILLLVAKAEVTQAQSWAPLDTVNNVIVYYAPDTNCLGQPSVFLKIENTGTSDVVVSWNLWNVSGTREIQVANSSQVIADCANLTPDYVLIEAIPAGESFTSMNPVFNVY